MNSTFNKEHNKSLVLYETDLHFLQTISNILGLILEKDRENSEKINSLERTVKHELEEIRLRDDATQRAIAHVKQQTTTIRESETDNRKAIDLLLDLWHEKGLGVLGN